MNSFALSYKLRGENEDKNQSEKNKSDRSSKKITEVHINIWKIQNCGIKSKTRFFFDFGVKLDPTIKDVCLFVPFEINERGKDFDLVRKLKDSNQLLCTVFNMDLKSYSSQKEQFSEVRNEATNKPEFYLYQLGASNFSLEQFKIGENGHSKFIGTLLKITLIEEINKINTPLYIRFRIEPKNFKYVIRSEHISNDLLQAAFSEIDMIDFRLNEQRDINPEVINKIRSEGYDFFSFNKVHLFFMAETTESIQNGSSIKTDSRLLEKNLWKNYIPDSTKDRCYIAHHWKKSLNQEKVTDRRKWKRRIVNESFNDYQIFFTSIYPKTKWIRLFVYLSVIILLSWVGSILSSDVFEVNDIRINSHLKFNIVLGLLASVVLYFIVTRYRILIRIIRK